MSSEQPQPAKRLYQVARRCLERAHDLEQKLFTAHVNVVEDRRHLDQNTPERGYYTIGYLQALQDVRALIDSGEFPAGRLDPDGGPRVPSTRPPPGD